MRTYFLLYFLSMNPRGFFSPNLVNIDNQLTIGSLLEVVAEFSFLPVVKGDNLGLVMVTRSPKNHPESRYTYPLCASLLRYDEANLLCKHFGFLSGEIYPPLRDSPKSRFAWQTDFDCYNSDTDPNACAKEWTLAGDETKMCSDKNLVFLMCDPKQSIYHLISLDLPWVDDLTDPNSAHYQDLKAQLEPQLAAKYRGMKFFSNELEISGFGQDSGVEVEYKVVFHGTPISGELMDVETKLESSVFRVDGVDVAVKMRGTTFSIVGGRLPNTGWVMAKRGNNSRLVCDSDGFADSEAGVLCRGLGYEWGQPVHDLGKPPGGSRLTTEIQCRGQETDLNSCLKGDVKQDNNLCKDQILAAVYCYGKVHLHSNGFHKLGIVLIANGSESSAVCSSGISDIAASLICQQLGLGSFGQTLHVNPFSTVYYGVGYASIDCDSDAADLNNCAISGDGSYKCDVAVVKCGPDEVSDGEVMADREALLVSLNGVFGEVCADGFDSTAAATVCKGKGFENSVTHRKPRDDNVPMWLYNMSCTDLNSCKRSWEPYNCQHAVVVFCYSNDTVTTLTLEGGTEDYYGYLIASYANDTWPVCATNGDFYDDEANVACKQMDFAGGQLYRGNATVPPTGKVLVAEINCNGKEAILDECRYGNWTATSDASSCNDGLVKVFCYRKYRLHTGFFNKSGIVLLPDEGWWAGICADNFDNAAARVVCRELHLSQNGFALSPNTYPDTRKRISRGGVSCTGQEGSILDCSQLMTACKGNRLATVLCADDLEEPIFTPKQDDQWRVLVQRNGITGTICASEWDAEDARVYCKNMTFEDGYPLKVDPIHSAPRWMSNFTCDLATDGSLGDCNHTTDLDESCHHEKDAGVFCYNRAELATYTLVNSPKGRENIGQVRATRYGHDHPMCGRHVTQSDAATICRSLGSDFVGGEPHHVALGELSDPVYWIVDMYCMGNEQIADICIKKWTRASKGIMLCDVIQVHCFEEGSTMKN